MSRTTRRTRPPPPPGELAAQQGFRFLDLPSGVLETIGQCAPPYSKPDLCRASKAIRDSLLVLPEACTVRLLDAANQSSAQQAGRALLLPSSMRLAQLTVLPALYGRGSGQVTRTTSPQLQAFFDSLTRHRLALTSEAHSLVIKGFWVEPGQLQLMGTLFPALHTLTLHRCSLGMHAFRTLASSLPGLPHLKVSKCFIQASAPGPAPANTTTGDLAHLGKLQLRSLMLSHIDNSTHLDALACLRQQPLASHLTSLTVSRVVADSDNALEQDVVQNALKCDLDHISHLTHLHSLSMGLPGAFQPEDFQALAGLSGLKELELEWPEKYVAILVPASVKQLTQVTRLTLNNLLVGQLGEHTREVHLTGSDCLSEYQSFPTAKAHLTITGQRLKDRGDVGSVLSGLGANPSFRFGTDGMLRLSGSPFGWGGYRYLRDPFSASYLANISDGRLQALELESFLVLESYITALGRAVGQRLQTLRLVNCRADQSAMLFIVQPGSPFTALRRIELVWSEWRREWLQMSGLWECLGAWPVGGRELYVHLAVPHKSLKNAQLMANSVMAPRPSLPAPPTAQQGTAQLPQQGKGVAAAAATTTASRSSARQGKGIAAASAATTTAAASGSATQGTGRAAAAAAATTAAASSSSGRRARTTAASLAGGVHVVTPVTVSVTTYSEECDLPESGTWIVESENVDGE